MSGNRANPWSVRAGAFATLVAVLLVSATSLAGAAQGSVVKEPQYGFSLKVPANWRQVPLNGSDVTALLNTATHDDPALTNALDSQVRSAASQGVKVFAVGPVSGAVAPNVNVIVSSSAGAPGGQAFAPAAVAEAKIELTQIAATHIETSITDNRLGRTADATYQLNLNGGRVFGAQVYAQHTSHLDIVTVTTSSAADSRSVLRFIENSWRWTS